MLLLPTSKSNLMKPGREHWVPDGDVADCHACSTPFGVLTRRHHCRACGNIFCSRCSSRVAVYTPCARQKEKGYTGKPKRVCEACFVCAVGRTEMVGDRIAGSAQHTSFRALEGPLLDIMAFIGEEPECPGTAEMKATDAAHEGGAAAGMGVVAARAAVDVGSPQPGDIVILGPGAPEEFRHHHAVVTKVMEGFCTAVVLDDSRRAGVGECWPMFADTLPASRALRLGTQVAIAGLKGPKSRRLNGYTGRIALHPREGHPSFIHTKARPDVAQFTVCVKLDNPPRASDKFVLLEPRFLAPHDDEGLADAARDLEDLLSSLTQPLSKLTSSL